MDATPFPLDAPAAVSLVPPPEELLTDDDLGEYEPA